MISCKTGVEILLQDHLAQIDEANRAGQLALVEERVLLLISQHLQRGFGQNGEIERRMLRCRIGEHKLMRQSRFPASRSARDELILIYGLGSCSIQQSGKLAKLWSDLYCFGDQFGLRVFLRPDDWKSVQFERNPGMVLLIDGPVGEGGFVLREDPESREDPVSPPGPIEISNDVLDQLTRWVQQRNVLLVLFHRGFHTTTGIFRANEVSVSKGQFILVDEKTFELHIMHLEKCLKIQLEKCQKIQLGEEKELCTMTLWDAHQIVEIGEIRGTAEDALARFTSDLVH